MGILNLTPDSFYSGSRAMDIEAVLHRVSSMLDAGADIIDIGACSTRPGSEPVCEEEEMSRLNRPLTEIRKTFPEAILSVDTFRASVAEECLKRYNVDIINDVSGISDPQMIDVVARHKAVYVLMHTRGTPADMDSRCSYGDVTAEVVSELAFKLNDLRAAGVCNIIVDPGFGFAKNTEQNLQLLSQLSRLDILGCPILAALSRKRMTREPSGCDIDDALIPTVALNSVALMNGASIIRVHDCREGGLTAKTIGQLWKSE